MASKLQVNRGTTYTLDIAYTRNGQPSDLTGCTFFFTVKNAEYDNDATDTSALIEKNVTTHDDAINGISSITLNPADTASIDKGKYYYDLKIKDATGAVYKLDEGKFVLDASPTNRLV